MKERPILFNGEMVRAILDGRKTQTRRMVKPQPRVVHSIHSDASITTNRIFRKGDQRIHSPFGTSGDRLWVRETWGLMSYRDTTDWCGYSIKDVSEAELREQFLVEHAANWNLPNESAYWRPSIHMPRWASRITLEITGVRVERVQDITEEDAMKEGCEEASLEHVEDCEDADCALAGGPHDCCGYLVSAKLRFKGLWQSTHNNWDANPWVWVYEFKRINP